MSRDPLSLARALMRRRKFNTAINLLDTNEGNYRNNSRYLILLGTAFLYIGDFGSAHEYFERARKITTQDTNLLLGQAVIFLRWGKTDRAVQYYLDIRENDPKNKIANLALEFIRKSEDEEITKYIATGKLAKFYPPVGINFVPIIAGVLAATAVCLAAYFALTRFVFIGHGMQAVGPRGDLSSIMLSEEDLRYAQETNMSGGTYRYILSNREITDSYALVLRYFQASRDNAAKIEVNRLNGSNASEKIKKSAQSVESFLHKTDPTFDTLTDNPPYADVAKDPLLYLGCFVAWAGRISNARMTEDGYRCDLLIGYETMERLEGVMPVHFLSAPEISGERPVRILAKIVVNNSKFELEGRAVYQSVEGALLSP